jgi:hypothetical protein
VTSPKASDGDVAEGERDEGAARLAGEADLLARQAKPISSPGRRSRSPRPAGEADLLARQAKP